MPAHGPPLGSSCGDGGLLHRRRLRRPARRPGARPASAPPGSTASTPSSETDRSTTVTSPKSHSICTSDSASTAKPAIAVVPEATTAAPVDGRFAGSRRRREPRRPLLGKRAESSTENSVEIARTSAPSVADSGFSGTRAGTARAPTSRRRARSAPAAPNAPLPAAVHEKEHQPHCQQARQQCSEPPQRLGQRRVRLGREHLQAGDPRGHALRRVEPPRRTSMIAAALERQQPDAEREIRRPPVGGDHRPREVRRHRVQQPADALASGRLRDGTGRAATAPGTGRPSHSRSRPSSRSARAGRTGSRASRSRPRVGQIPAFDDDSISPATPVAR